MTPIQLMALIVALLSLVKILVILADSKSWLDMVKKFYSKNNVLTTCIFFILAAFSFYYLIIFGLSITEIFAVMFFLMFLIGMGYSMFSKEFVGMATQIYANKKNPIKKVWFLVVIWLFLIALVLYEIWFSLQF